MSNSMPSLQQVKSHFENAKEIMSPLTGRTFLNENNFHFNLLHNTWYHVDKSGYNSVVCDGFQFAKIVSFKEKTFSLTADQLRSITDPQVKQWFPEVFEIELNKWYKWEGNNPTIGFVTGKAKEYDCFVFSYNVKGIFSKGNTYDSLNRMYLTEATEAEVFEALKNEAVKRGYKKGIWIKGIKNESPIKIDSTDFNQDLGIDSLRLNAYIFKNGKWAEIIPTKTKSEAEKELNCKIVD